MDFNSTIDLIIRELDEAREIIDDLKKFPGVPALQVELAKSKCKSAGDVIALLKNLQLTAPAEKTSNQSVSFPVEQKADDEELINDIVSDTQDRKDVFPGKSVVKAVHEQKSSIPEPIKETRNAPSERPVFRNEPELVKHGDTKAPDAEEDPQPVKKPYVAPIIADSFSHLANRFNEQIGSGNDDELNNSMKKKHLTALSEAIGVNDRFYFIREIFNGNKEAYSEAISRLEKAENMTEAKAVIMSYKKDKAENEAVKQLLDLVKRKFNSNE